MWILNLITLIICAVLFAEIIGRDIEDVLPPVVFIFLSVLYCIALLGKSRHSYGASLILFVGVWLFYFIKKKRLIPGVYEIKRIIIRPGFVFYLIVIGFAFTAYGNHFVNVWDDFHYNATFPKDMYYYGTMPTGGHSATFYRSYPPLMQLFFYWGFLGQRGFDEALMFRYKIFLIYTCLLPMFKSINNRISISAKVSMGIVTLIMPYVFMFELLESLSMDTFMAVLFGYALIHILFCDRHDGLTYCKIITSLVCLTLVKQIAPVFTAITLAVWFTVEWMERKEQEKPATIKGIQCFVPWLAAGFVNGIFYLSWRVFCNIKGNSVYLSGKLADSVNGGGIKLPSYTGETLRSFFKAIFTYNLNLAGNGPTLFASVLFAGLVIWYMNRKKMIGKRVNAGFVVIGAALVMYLALLLYTYLFVFYDWEAESLSSIDRYFGTYALAIVYIVTFGMVVNGPYKKTGDITDKVLIVIAFMFIVCTPWINLYNNMIPSRYMDVHKQAYDDSRIVAAEIERLNHRNLEVRTVMVVTNEGNSIYSRGMIYDLIPLIPAEYIIDDPELDHSAELLDKCRDSKAYYVYFSDRLVSDDEKRESVAGALREGLLLEGGRMYRYDESDNSIALLEQ